MKRLVTAAIIAALAIWTSPAARADGQRVIITFAQGTTPDARAQALKAMGATPLSSIATNGRTDKEFTAVVAEVPQLPQVKPGASGDTVMGLDDQPAPGVLGVERDVRVKWIESASFQSAAFPINASLSELGLSKLTLPRRSAEMVRAMAERSRIPWGIQRVNAPAAWAYTKGAGARVAVIDTGIDFTHPDLAGRVVGGYNAMTGTENPQDYADDNGHGTHVAGTIAGIGAGQDGVYGVAPEAQLYAVKVLDSDGSGNLSDVVKGIVWCANNGIQVANMSLGAPQGSDAMERALRYAKARDVVVVAAAGNSGGAVGYPGAYPEVIAVAASDWSDHIASFSSRGPEVKFIAPGVAVMSTMAKAMTGVEGDFGTLSGTSMATPHVTGLAALAVSQGYRGLDGPDGVLAQLESAATPLPGLTPNEQGYGMIDAFKLTRPAASLAQQ